MSIDQNYKKLLEQIHASQKKSKWGQSVKLVGVSKKQSVESMKSALAAGLTDLGENFVQEFAEKIHDFSSVENLNWHFIGRIQGKKIKDIVGVFNWIHGVSELHHLEKINQVASEKNIVQKILLQVNIADEPSKNGIAKKDVAVFLEESKSLSSVSVEGLMIMPPLVDSGEDNRNHFAEAKTLAEELGLNELSMGTSGDFQVAIEEGATMVRLGTILFGART